jgi:predicted PurR-regulated permease PerM
VVRCDRVGALIEAPFASMRVTHNIAQRDPGDASLGALRQARWTVMAVALVALAIVAILALHLTIAMIAGMLAYIAGNQLTDWLRRHTRLRHPAIWSVAILVALIAGAVSLAVDRAGDSAASAWNYERLMEQMAGALEQFRDTLPAWLAAHVPSSLDALRTAAVAWLRDHAAQVRVWGQDTLRLVTYAVAGALIGGLAIVEARSPNGGPGAPTPWIGALTKRFALFEQSFGAVVFAQLMIATVNAILTGIYVLAVLPAIGARLPMALTLVAFTFLASLVPIVGNLASSTAIVVVSLTQGMAITALSLGFLVAIHKLEYLLNAQIVGRRIRTRAFELLAIMLFFEAMFGLAGLVMAPIIYAYAKAELRDAGWL